MDKYECAGDHAGGWETSHMLALHPETVDMTLLRPKGQKNIGAHGKMHPAEASAKFGNEIIDKAVDIAVKEAQSRLKNRELYIRNGVCLMEGLWKGKESD
jgi:creatinine amidohydrolase